MARQSLEEMIQELQKTVEAQEKKIQQIIEALDKKVQRSDDVIEIQNLMGRYEAWHTVGMHDKVLELFAKNVPGVSIDIPHFGRWEGFEGVRKCWEVHNLFEGDRLGFLATNVDATPTIEVAGDGKTAKGTWTAIGCITVHSDAKDKMQAIWTWKRYAMDFVKEDGKWKFWHFRVFPLFGTPYEKSWVEESLAPSQPTPETMQIPEELKPDKPFSPYYTYSTTTIVPYAPRVPEPYETWDDSMSF
jgi:hypothetical protein